jgi:hypothetical protein
MYESIGNTIPMKSGAAIARGSFVKLSGTNAREVIQSAAEGDFSIGVAVEGATGANKWISVQLNGVASALFGGTVGVNGAVEVDANGAAVAAAGAAAMTVGYALEGGAAGEERPVLLVTPVARGPANA